MKKRQSAYHLQHQICIQSLPHPDSLVSYITPPKSYNAKIFHPSSARKEKSMEGIDKWSSSTRKITIDRIDVLGIYSVRGGLEERPSPTTTHKKSPCDYKNHFFPNKFDRKDDDGTEIASSDQGKVRSTLPVPTYYFDNSINDRYNLRLQLHTQV